MKDTLGDRMKMYEAMEAQRRFMPGLPIVARIDGRCFSKFTKGMKRPYDPRMQQAMINTTTRLVEATNARIGYTQSDEITLIWDTDPDSQFFNGRISKMTSQLAAQATLMFYLEVQKLLPEFADRLPTFDARVWNVPSKEEAVNCLVWREWDATKNSITMAASHYYSHKQLQGKNGSEKQEMLFQKGVNWNDYPVAFKRGAYVQRTTKVVPFTPEELDRLPPKHEARFNPDLKIERRVVREIQMPPITTVMNRVEVVFEGASPITKEILDQDCCCCSL